MQGKKPPTMNRTMIIMDNINSNIQIITLNEDGWSIYTNYKTKIIRVDK